jgi:hypothetical protein
MRFKQLSAKSYPLITVALLALALRLILIPNPGFEADVAFWKSWGLSTVDFGIVNGMKVANNNYPTPFAYTLGAMVWIYKLFADPHNFNQFWNNTNVLFLAVSKMFPILADFGIAGIIIYFGKFISHSREGGNLLNKKKIPDRVGDDKIIFGLNFYELLAVIYLLNPVSLADGSWWGQVDAVGVFVFLLALLAVLKRRLFLAGFIFMLSMMTKLQNMIYGPLFFLFVYQLTGLAGLTRAAAGAFAGFVGLNIEFVLSRNMDRVLANLTENYDYFPWMSLNAFNLWWIVSGGHGMLVSDKMSVLGLANAKTVGLVLFSGMYLFAVLRVVIPGSTRNLSSKNWTPESSLPAGKQVRGDTIKTFLESLIIVNASFFLFQTQSHDRYAFPLIVFFLFWSYFINGKNVKLFAILYTLFTIFYCYNLHTALVINYPHNGLPILSQMTQPIFTITTSIIFLILFCIFIFYIAKNSLITRYSLLVTCILCVFGLFSVNYPLFTRSPIQLTTITPIISEQDYGSRQTDKEVSSSFGGPVTWIRLSDQYAFYAHGIGTHANSKHVYDIHGLFRSFRTDYGIDTEAGTKASAQFEIYGDNRLLFRSETMGRFTMPRHVEISVRGVHFLMLKTTDAGDSNYDDHTDWLNPTLWP